MSRLCGTKKRAKKSNVCDLMQMQQHKRNCVFEAKNETQFIKRDLNATTTTSV